MQQIVTIRELRAEGLGPSAIARRLGIDRKTANTSRKRTSRRPRRPRRGSAHPAWTPISR